MEQYIVSARKYRPGSFDTVVGQSALTTTLKNAIARGKLAHAYLFCGPRGVGKTTCARIFAKNINCEHPTPAGEACNECDSCRAFSEQRSFNIYELDAASNNSVDDIRQLTEQAVIPPQTGRYKVFIIDEVHMLTSAAFNAFLKTLEEPPAHAIFILATTEKHKILPTILSRCQIFDFARMTVSDIVSHLEYVAEREGVSYEPEALHVIAEKADGGMRDALSIFDQTVSYCEGNLTYAKVTEDLNVLDYDEYFAMTDLLLKPDAAGAMLRFDAILKRGFQGNYFVGGMASHVRNLLMSRDEATLPLLEVSQRVRDKYKEQAARCKPRYLYKALKLFNDCDLNYRQSHNKRLLVELTLLQAGQVMGDEDDTVCGRGPARRLNPIFTAVAPQAATATPQATPAPSTPNPTTAAAHATATTPPSATPHHAPAPQPTAPAAGPQPDGQGTTRPMRSAHTLSIKALSARYRQEVAATATSPAPQTDATPPQNGGEAQPQAGRHKPFTQDSLVYYWFRYAQQLPREQAALSGRMRGMEPQLLNDWQVKVVVENAMVEQYMSDILPSLTSYLRTQLSNDSIQLHLEIVAETAAPRAFSRQEIFREWLQKSPAFRQLTDVLGLELS